MRLRCLPGVVTVLVMKLIGRTLQLSQSIAPASVTVIISTCVLGLSGCAGDSAQSAPAQCDTFRTLLTVKDRMSQPAQHFIVGEPITFELQVANTTNFNATLTAGSTCGGVVFEVFDNSNQRRFGSMDGVMCIQMTQPRTYASLEATINAYTWNQAASDNQVEPGTYSVVANVGQWVTNAEGQQIDCKVALQKTASFTIQ
jgi:hypothetical protein